MHHILEPAGRGGVYQHVLSYALEKARDGRRVVLHTARDNELSPVHANLTYCRCMRWQRRGGKYVRQFGSLAWVMFWLLPHLWRTARGRDFWEVQGRFGNGAYLLSILALRARGVEPAFAPHNDFSRDGNALEERARLLSERLSAGTIVFRDGADIGRPRGAVLIRRSLTQYVPEDWTTYLPQWRTRWGSVPVVLFAGQLRMDKDPALLVRASQLIEQPHLLAFVGEDLGARPAIMEAASEAGVGVDICSAYLPLAEFAAALASARIVVCPYRVASQSGVLALARSLGTTTIASRVGGLTEQADRTFRPGDAADLAAQISAALSAPADEGGPSS